MIKLSKVQFSQAIEAADAANVKKAPRAVQNQNRTSRFILTALIAALGIGAGWIGGRVLNRSNDSAITDSPSAASSESAVPGSQLQSDSRHGKRAATEEKPDTSLEAAPEGEQPVIEPESRAMGVKSREIPPKVPRIEKDEESDKAAAEDPSKEIGREALRKMSKENRKMQRGQSNKNEKDDRP